MRGTGTLQGLLLGGHSPRPTGIQVQQFKSRQHMQLVPDLHEGRLGQDDSPPTTLVSRRNKSSWVEAQTSQLLSSADPKTGA